MEILNDVYDDTASEEEMRAISPDDVNRRQRSNFWSSVRRPEQPKKSPDNLKQKC